MPLERDPCDYSHDQIRALVQLELEAVQYFVNLNGLHEAASRLADLHDMVRELAWHKSDQLAGNNKSNLQLPYKREQRRGMQVQRR